MWEKDVKKRSALPLFWQRCTQRPFMWRTTLTKTAHNITSLLSQIKELVWKGGEGAACIKSRSIPLVSKPPPSPFPGETGSAQGPLWLIYQRLLKSQQQRAVRGSDRVGMSPPRCLTTWFMLEQLRKIGGLGGLKWRKIKTESTVHASKAKDPLLRGQ